MHQQKASPRIQQLYSTSEYNSFVILYDNKIHHFNYEFYFNFQTLNYNCSYSQDDRKINIDKLFESYLQQNITILLFEKAQVLQEILKNSKKGLVKSQVLKLCRKISQIHIRFDQSNTHLISVLKRFQLDQFYNLNYEILKVPIFKYEIIYLSNMNIYLMNLFLGFRRNKNQHSQELFECKREPEQNDFSQNQLNTVDSFELKQLMYYKLFKVCYNQNSHKGVKYQFSYIILKSNQVTFNSKYIGNILVMNKYLLLHIQQSKNTISFIRSLSKDEKKK
ncbi:unnamed protein product [Paramecium sonneborni]|uniref:Uncharacterized protein n=1 Tax=Paramecium sonneborni TaxID=65129 RepID=A0A8S1NQD8_9CILI|nr:unnamed protein product [Paramecium sonneborni]